MGTRSTIGYKEGNDIHYVSCHWDGYYDYNGRILLENYKTLEQVKELVSFGNMSSLGTYSVPKGEHSYDKPEPGCTVYYHRDRGEDPEPFKHTNNEGNFFREAYYSYLFKDNDWYVDHEGEGVVPLSTVLEYG